MPDFPTTTPPKPSSLPEDIVSKLIVDVDVDTVLKDDSFNLPAILDFQRAANYISAAQIFLQANALLLRPLTKDDVKSRLLGHWGTCPGLNLIYAHCNAFITRHTSDEEDIKVLFVTGPGHGAPAILACTYLEGAITQFYPQYSFDEEGLNKLVRSFSWPGGFPSHINPETPGSIHEGGELGYALAVAFGSVMDNKDLITVCVVGDGEAETGATATAWHSHKYIDPAESGAVLPILHCNGFKICERTIPGTMDNLELACLFTGYGYQVRFVEYGPIPDTEEEVANVELDLNANLLASIEWAYREIRKIQRAAREGKPITKPRWPMIVLRTPKGMTGPRMLGGLPVEGSWRSHQVPLPSAKTDDEQFSALVHWLKSYHPEELFSSSEPGFVKKEVLSIIPKRVERRMGTLKESYAGYKPLDVPDFEGFGVPKNKEESSMKVLGKFLAAVIEKNPTTFRIFSPDEFSSNKLDGALVNTHRQFQWDPEVANSGGRLIEMLSEHTLQGFLQGYTLTGRTGLFPSYEAFLGIVSTMVEQYAKFRKVSMETKWRDDVASINYIETSTLWRQEHNGYSHQNPSFIGQLLTLPSTMVRIYLPPDANTTLCVMAHCLRSKNYVNLVIGSKADTNAFLSVEEANTHCIAGISVWKSYSTDDGVNPDVTLVGIGVETTVEIIAAAKLLQNEGVRVRVINVVDLMVLGEVGTHPHALSPEAFNALFGRDVPAVFNFHGYPAHVKSLIFSRAQALGRQRFEILGYIEQGTTTTPWSMLRMNKAGRYDVAERAIALIATFKPDSPIGVKAHVLQSGFKHQNEVEAKYAIDHGKDSPTVSAAV